MAISNRVCGIVGWAILLSCLLSMLGMFALGCAVPEFEERVSSLMFWVIPLTAPGFALVWVGQSDRTHRILCGEWLHCPKCNYDLCGQAVNSRQRLHCPECGDDFSVEYIQEYWKEKYLGPRDGSEG